MTSLTVYISCTNSDDKLPQFDWAGLCAGIDEAIDDAARPTGVDVHGRWYSLANEPWQNACWLVKIDAALPGTTHALRERLVELARLFRQDSIAWAVVHETEFLTPR